MLMRSLLDDMLGLIFYSLLEVSSFQESLAIRCVVGRYSLGSACLAWFYRKLCRASHINTHDISRSLILLKYGYMIGFHTLHLIVCI